MRAPKPWFRTDRQAWFVTIAGKRHNLGPDKDQAKKRFHALMAAESPTLPTDSVLAICQKFVDWVKTHLAPDTHRWYKDRLDAFLNAVPENLAIADLKPFHVQEWVDAMPHKSGTKRNYVRAVKRAMLWAEEQGYILRSPIVHMKQPAGGRRDNVIAPKEHKTILKLTTDANFRDLCDFCYLTGARCAEAIAVEKRHLDLANHRVIFPVEEEKMERIPRIIYLDDKAEKILKRLALKHPEGKLFRNTLGNDWHPDATNCRFRTIASKIGRKVCLTDYRHSMATRLLTAGVDALTVSILLGHSDPSMLARVYQHVNHEHSYLLEAVRKASRVA